MTDEEKREQLKKMVKSVMKNNPEEAQIDFHGYYQDKMKSFLGTGNEEVEPEEAEKTEK